MSFVFTDPESIVSAGTDLAALRSAITAPSAAAFAPTIRLQAAAATISTAIAAVFGQQAMSFQTVSTQAAEFHQQFAQALRAGGNSYALAEANNVQQTVLDAINAPTQTLLGHPLIGNGADGTAASPNGGAGGLLYGNGGNGFCQTTAGLAGSAGGAAGLIGMGGRRRRRCQCEWGCRRQWGLVVLQRRQRRRRRRRRGSFRRFRASS